MKVASCKPACVALILGICASTLRADELTAHQLRSAGTDRTYHVHTGKATTKGLPAVLVLHGGGGNGKILKDTYGFKPFIEKGEMIAVYPDAGKAGWVPEDVGFLDEVLDAVLKREQADPERLFVTGASRGGIMTFMMVAKSKHKFRAAGTVIGSMLPFIAKDFKLPHSIDFAMINGTADPLMPYTGGWGAMGKPKTSGAADAKLVAVDEVIQLLLKANGIEGEPNVTTLGDRDQKDGCTNEVRNWRDGKRGVRVMLVKVEGGGHVVPGGRQYLGKDLIGPACGDFDHAEVIWEYFKATKGVR